jgi:putative oxygen-independent coproporphyrinogen III oxidase
MFGIYVHWPFCASKCPYCDFNSHVREHIDENAWRDAYLTELRHYASLTEGRTVDSIFFGGGTPSLMHPNTTQAIIDEVSKLWRVKNNIEVTLEANPTSVEAEKFKAFRQAGVNRVSMGIQALNDPDLQFLGRQHNAQEAIKAIKIASSTFDRFSFDLIYARPQQTVSAWTAELKEALQYAVGHLSLYQLTIEEGTPFYTRYNRGEFTIPNDEEGAALYEATQEVLSLNGMPSYEVSNHARPDEESRHNLVYWRYGDYVGVGPGAHGRLTLNDEKWGTRAHRAPEIWLKRVQENGHGAHPHELVDRNARLIECLMMGMRLKEGVPLSRLNEESGSDWRLTINQDKVRLMIEEGMLQLDNDNIAATPQGLQRLNALLAYLL